MINVVYKEPKTLQAFAKRFIIDKFLVDKIYRYLDEDQHLEVLTTDLEPKIHLVLVPKLKQKITEIDFNLTEVLVKGVGAKGIRITPRAVKKIVKK